MPRKRNDPEDAKLARIMGTALRSARKLVGLTQAEAAARAGTATEVYGRIERGHAIPSIPMLLSIGRALGAQPNELLGATPVSDKPLAPSLHSPMAALPNTPDMRRLLLRMSKMQPRHIRTLAYLAAQLSNAQSTGVAP
jgi:transcriptional regulator with XRE-family HTH domain